MNAIRVVPNEYCNECKRDTYLVVSGFNEHSIFADCPHCGAKFDLIREGTRNIDVEPNSERVYVFYRLNSNRQAYTLEFNGKKVIVSRAKWNRYVAEQHVRNARDGVTISGGISVDYSDLRQLLKEFNPSKRIAWYTRKVAQLGAVHPSKRTARHDHRAKRLVAYKQELCKQIRGGKLNV